MPFGKNKKLSGPRPKKKKVVRIEEEPEESPTIEEDGGGAEEHVAANNMENIGGNGGAACEVPNSPGKLLREEAKDIWKEAVADTVQYQQKLADALREEKMRQRLREAKIKRWDAAEKRKQPPSAVMQMDRAYKTTK